jgi:hypothetical protein
MSGNYANTSAALAAQSTPVYSAQQTDMSATSHYADVDAARDPIAHYSDVNVFVDVGQLQTDQSK